MHAMAIIQCQSSGTATEFADGSMVIHWHQRRGRTERGTTSSFAPPATQLVDIPLYQIPIFVRVKDASVGSEKLVF